MRRIALIAIAALGLTAQAWAAPPHLYEIDVLVFANHLHRLDGNEDWSQEKITPVTGYKKALSPSHGLPGGSPLAVAQSILARHPHYTILAARSWVQDAVALHETKPVRIASRRFGRLKGVIRVFQWRLMHVALDLHYTPPGSSVSSNPALVYQLIQSRPVALDRINYFDHPKFGVLVEVMPYNGPLGTPR